MQKTCTTKIKLTLACFLLFAGMANAWAQTHIVRGRVTDAKTGEALIGANVVIKGTTNGTITDVEGSYQIEAESSDVLSFSFVGYASKEYPVGINSQINATLDEGGGQLDEVVVMGYGSQKVTTISGAVAQVKSESIVKLTPVRAEEALQGNIAGVNVIQSGSPGSKPTVLIRGIPSYGGNDPLVIVDGIQQTITDLNAINPNDIESMSVLKDAATTAIYGVKGGNGVIIVKTKSGKRGESVKVDYSGSYGIQEVTRLLPVLNATEYAVMLNEGSLLSGGNAIFNDLSSLGKGTNWQKEVFKSAPFQSHNMSATGGSEAVTYFLSAGYLSQGGIVGGADKNRFDRINLTSNLTFKLHDKVQLKVNTSYQNFFSKGVPENAFNSVIGHAINYDPTVPVYNTVPNTVGQYGFSNIVRKEIFNPLTVLENTYNQSRGNKLYGLFELNYEVIKNLKLSARFGYTTYADNAKTFTPLVFYGLNNEGNTMNADGSTKTGSHNSVAHSKGTHSTNMLELFGNYDFTINSLHHVETTAGLVLRKGFGNTAYASRQDVPFNSWTFADFSAATGIASTSNTAALTGGYSQYFNRNASAFLRVIYDYSDKYLASFTIRHDGSYAFGDQNKFGNFYSGSLGWVISKESFFNVPMIDFLKLRTSYGVIGNDNNVDPKATLATIQTDYLNSVYANGNTIGYPFGSAFLSGATLASYTNPNLRWEQNAQFNIGFDVTLLKSKVDLSIDYFDKRTKGLLFLAQFSGYLGTVPPPLANIGTTKSSGVDISLTYRENITKDLKLSNTFAFTTSRNEVTKTSEDNTVLYSGGYYNGQSQTATIFAKGYAPGAFYGYQTNGLFQNYEDIKASATQDNAQPGDIRYVDVNGDGKIDANDRTLIGNPFPKFTLGWTLNATYKNFDFTAFSYISYGNDIFRAYERNDAYTNKYAGVLNRWTGEGSTNDARYPRYTFTDANSNSRTSDRYVSDGSFYKLKNVVVGYTLPKGNWNKSIRRVRVYAQVKNAFVFTKYDGFDPEIPAGGLLDTGVDRGAYPQARTYFVGIDLGF